MFNFLADHRYYDEHHSAIQPEMNATALPIKM